MKPVDQILFVKNLASAVANSIVEQIAAGRIPEEWDGHELRELLAEAFDVERSEPMRDKRSRRYRAYEQIKLNLPR